MLAQRMRAVLPEATRGRLLMNRGRAEQKASLGTSVAGGDGMATERSGTSGPGVVGRLEKDGANDGGNGRKLTAF